MANTAFTFQSTTFNVVERDGQMWLRASDIARALGYANDNAVTRIFSRNEAEFTGRMTEKVTLTLSGNLTSETRIFSLRGAHLIGMFARTPRAAEFRRWVLDVLENNIPTMRTASDDAAQQLGNALLKAIQSTGSHTASRRWMLSAEQGNLGELPEISITTVEPNALVMTPRRLAQYLVEPNGLMLIDPDDLALLATNALTRLKESCEFYRSKSQGIPVKLKW